MMITGKMLQRLRVERGLFQKELAEMIGVPTYMISKYENDHSPITDEQKSGCYKALGIKNDEHAGEIDNAIQEREQTKTVPFRRVNEEQIQYMLENPVAVQHIIENYHELKTEKNDTSAYHLAGLLVDFQTLFAEIKMTEHEKRSVSLILAGYNQQEVAKKLGVRRQVEHARIHNIVKKITGLARKKREGACKKCYFKMTN